MSQPLRNVLGRELPTQQDPERGPQLSNRETQTETRMLPLRSVISLIMLLAGLVCVPVGVGMLAGTGAAIVAIGALSLALGVALEVL